MKKSFNFSFKTIFFLALFLGTAPPGHALDSEYLSAFTERGMELWHVPGMSVAVVNKDSIEYQRNFGQTAAKDGQAVDEHTLPLGTFLPILPMLPVRPGHPSMT